MRISDLSSDVCSSDLLGNVGLIQSFVRLAIEVQQFGALIERALRVQFPVLTWWATVTVLTRASATRSEERRVGKGCASPCRSRWTLYHSKQKKQITLNAYE